MLQTGYLLVYLLPNNAFLHDSTCKNILLQTYNDPAMHTQSPEHYQEQKKRKSGF